MDNNNNLPSTISGDGRKFISLLKNYLADISDVVNDIYTVLGTDESTVLEIDEYIKNVQITEKKVGGNVTLEISWNKDDIVQYAGVDILVKEKTEYYTGNWGKTEVTRTYKTGKVTQFTLENISVGHSYQITVLGRNMKGATSKADSSPAVEYYVSPNDHTPLMPYDFTVVFDKRGAYWSWKQRDNSGTQWTELRLDENAGMEYNRLDITTGLYSTAIPTVRVGKAYLYNKGIGNAYTAPATVNYSKAVPAKPTQLVVKPVIEGLNITFASIPEDCTGAIVYVNNEENFVMDNSLNYLCSTGTYTVKVCYIDIFGNGEMSDPITISTIEEIPIEMLNKEKLGINAINQGITEINNAREEIDKKIDSLENADNDANVKIDSLNSYRTEVDKKIGNINTALTTMDGVIDAKVKDAKDTAEARLTVTEDAINSAIDDKIAGVNSSITQLSNAVDVKVKDAKDTAESRLTATANAINSTVSDNFNNLQTSITQVADGIEVKVKAGVDKLTGQEIVSRINLAPDTVSISGKYIHITGQTVFDDGVIVAKHIGDKAVIGTKIADGAITTDKLVANAITGDKIAANAITSDKIKTGEITAEKIATNTITGDKLAANTITGDKIVAGTISGDKIAANSISGDKIQAGSIDADKIQAGVIDASKLNVSSLDAITANVGNLTGGTITGGTFKNENGSFSIDPNGNIIGANITGSRIDAESIYQAGYKIKNIIHTTPYVWSGGYIPIPDGYTLERAIIDSVLITDAQESVTGTGDELEVLPVQGTTVSERSNKMTAINATIQGTSGILLKINRANGHIKFESAPASGSFGGSSNNIGTWDEVKYQVKLRIHWLG